MNDWTVVLYIVGRGKDAGYTVVERNNGSTFDVRDTTPEEAHGFASACAREHGLDVYEVVHTYTRKASKGVKP